MKSPVIWICIAATVSLFGSTLCAQVNKNAIKPIRPLQRVKIKPAKSSAPKSRTAKRTKFDPAKHGFKFSNTFKTELVVKDVRFGGLCGGMAYAALDYFNKKMKIPDQKHRPAVKTPLFNHIYDRQKTSILKNVDKWAELGLNPFGARSDEFFRWGLEGKRGGRLWELGLKIDGGKPVPLGLFCEGNGGFRPHHQVLAIGYDKGRYQGDLGPFQNDLKIFVYDPNYPSRTMTLVPDTQKKDYYYKENPRKRWKTYFVDMKYETVAPPVVAKTRTRDDGLVRELFLKFQTGGDDLRGGNDNLNVVVKYKNGTTFTKKNVNRGGRWINNYHETVRLQLPRGVKLESIQCVILQTTFSGGLGGDNWNLDRLTIEAQVGSKRQPIYQRSGRPLVRFNGDNTPFEAKIR